MSIATPKIGSFGDDAREHFGSDASNSDWDDGLSIAQSRKLFRLNIAAFVAQLGSGLLIFFLTDSDKKYTVYTAYPAAADSTDADGPPFLVPVPKEIFSLGVGYLSAAFLFLSALDHLLVSTVGKKLYENGLDQSYNVFRWVEYSLSASIMRVIIGLLSGLVDINTLIAVFGHTLVTMVFGLIFEIENSGKRLHKDEVRWYTYWLGFIPHAFSWGPVITYFVTTASAGGAPTFVYAIVFTVFLLDLTFPIVLGLQWRGKGMFKDYANGEVAFIILSFTSKNALAWINFIGGNR